MMSHMEQEERDAFQTLLVIAWKHFAYMEEEDVKGHMPQFIHAKLELKPQVALVSLNDD